MANPNENLRRLYENGLKHYSLPDFDTFSQDMKDEQKRRRFYTNMQQAYSLPDFDTFSQDIGAVAPPATAQPVTPVWSQPHGQSAFSTVNPITDTTAQQASVQQPAQPEGVTIPTIKQRHAEYLMTKANESLKALGEEGKQRMESIEKGNKPGASMGEREFNPSTGKVEPTYYTTQGERVPTLMEQRKANIEHRQWWENNTEAGQRSKEQRLDREFKERLSGLWRRNNPTEGENAAEQAWSAAEARQARAQEWNANYIYRDRGSAMANAAFKGGTQNQLMNTAILNYANTKDHFKNYDLDRIMNESWDNLGEDGQKALIDDCYQMLRHRNPGADELVLYNQAKEFARKQSDIRLYNLAVEKNLPSGNLEYLIRKIGDMNLIMNVSKGLAVSGANGKTGDMAAYENANEQYRQDGHRVIDTAGMVAGFALDPTTWVSAGVGNAAYKGAMWAGGRVIAGKAASKVVTQAATRQFATTMTGRIAGGVVAGAANFGFFEGAKEAENQFAHGGHIVGQDDTGRYINEGYSADAVVGAAAHGLVMGGAVGWLTPVSGNVSDKLVRGTSSTVGKVATRAGVYTGATIAEGTIFSVPEWMEGERDAMDVWNDNMAMMIGFKSKHMLKSAGNVLGDLKASFDSPTNGKKNRLDFESRLRRRMDTPTGGDVNEPTYGDMSLTKDEKAELERYGYDLLDLVKNSERTGDAKAGTLITQDAPEIVSRLTDVVADSRLSEAVRAKMYYYATGRKLPMSTVMRGELLDDGDGGFVVESQGANGVITSRSFKSRKAADLELERIKRQAELNTIELGERYQQIVDLDNRVQEASRRVAVKNGWDPVEVYKTYEAVRNILHNKPTELTDVQNNIYSKIVAELEGFKENKDLATEKRNAINEKYGVDIDRAIRKEANRRTLQEQTAIDEYIDALMPEKAKHKSSSQKLLGSDEPQINVDEAGVVDIEATEVTDKSSEPAEGNSKTPSPAGGEQMPIGRATMKYKDRAVEVLSGRVVMTEDGTMVDNGLSDGSIVIRDLATGKVEMVSPDAILTYEEYAAPATREEAGSMPSHAEESAGDVQPQSQYASGQIKIRNSDGTESRGVLTGYIDEDGKHEYYVEGDLQRLHYATDHELDNILSEYVPDEPQPSDEPSVPVESTPSPTPTSEPSSTSTEAPQDDVAMPAGVNPVGSISVPQQDGSTRTFTVGKDAEGQNVVIDDRGFMWAHDGNGNSIQPYSPGANVPMWSDEQLAKLGTVQPINEQSSTAANQSEGVPNVAENRENGVNVAPETTENAVSEPESTSNSDVSVENVQQVSALSRIPVDEKSGEPIFEHAPDHGTAWDGLVEAVGSDARAADIAKAQVDNITAELTKLTGKQPKLTGSPMQMAAQQKEYQEKIDALRGRLEAWNGIVAVDGVRRVEAERAKREAELQAELKRQEQERKAQREAERQRKLEETADNLSQYRKAIMGWDEPLSLREYLLRALLSGVKLRWSNSKAGSHGMAGHLFGNRSNHVKKFTGEYGKMKWMVDDVNGMAPETFAERVCQDYYNDYEQDTDHSSEVFNELLDVLMLGTPKGMWDELNDMRKQVSEDEYYGMTQEEMEAEQAWRDRYGMNEESWLSFEESNGDFMDMTDDEYREFIRGIADGHADRLADERAERELYNEIATEYARQQEEFDRMAVDGASEAESAGSNGGALGSETGVYNDGRGSTAGQEGAAEVRGDVRQASSGNVPAGVAGDARGMGERSGDMGKAKDRGVKEWYENLRLSDELDENGRPFITSQSGGIDFGNITSEHNLPAAPVRLSMGDVENGYIHINFRHGQEIKKAGFSSIEQFVHHVLTNATRIQEGAAYEKAIGDKNQTYLVQAIDDKNNTLYIQLSRNGEYWNVNSAGVFGKRYGNKKRSIWSASAQQNDVSAHIVNGSQSKPNAEEGSTSIVHPSNASSADKGSESSVEKQAERTEANNGIDPWGAVDRIKSAQLRSREGVLDVYWGATDESPSILVQHPSDDDLAYEIKFDGEEWVVNIVPVVVEYGNRKFGVSVVPIEERHKLPSKLQRRIKTKPQPAMQRDIVSKYVPRELREYFESGEAYEDNKVLQGDGARGRVYNVWGIVYAKAGSHGSDVLEKQVETSNGSQYEGDEQVSPEPRVARRLSESVRELGYELEDGDVDFEIGKSYALAEGGYMTVIRLDGWSVTARVYDKDGKLQGTWEEPAYPLMRLIDDSVNAEPTATEAVRDEADMSSSLQWSDERAGNGEPFLIGENGVIDLVDIPQEVFDKMGIDKAPFRLTPSMVAHVYERHKRELHLNSPEDAVKAILDVMTNFDRVRQGRENTYVFAVEGARSGSARRAVTFVLEYDKGEWLGIKTVGYDRISNLKELPILWEKGEKNSSTTGVAPANVTSDQSLHGDQTGGIASNQNKGVSTGKGSASVAEKQAVEDESSNSYAIDRYVKRGKKGSRELVRVVFPRVEMDVWKERLNLARKMGGEQVPNGYGFKTEEVARAFAEAVMNPDAATGEQKSKGEIKLSEQAKPVESTKPKKRRWISDEDVEEFDSLHKDLRKHFGKDDNMAHEAQASYGKPKPKQMDAEVLHMGTRMTYLMMKGGLRSFSDYCEAMKDELPDIFDDMRPHLKSLYAAAQNMEEVIDLGWDEEMDDRKTVKAFDVYNFDKSGAKDFVDMAQHIVDEEASQKETEQIIQTLNGQRNEQEKKEAGLTKKRQNEKESKSINGYKVGDEVMYQRNGKGMWAKYKITDFDRNGRPILDSFGVNFISEVVDWEHIKPANGVFAGGQAAGELKVGEAESVANKKPQQHQSASSHKGQDLTTSSATDIETVSGANIRIFSEGEKLSAKNELNKLIHKYVGKKSTHGFLTDISVALGERNVNNSPSHYFDIKSNNGDVVTLRISNHNVNSEYADGREISIVVKSNRQSNRFRDAVGADVTEYVYFKEAIAKGDGQTLAWIIQDISNMLDTGEYADSSRVAVVNRSQGISDVKPEKALGGLFGETEGNSLILEDNNKPKNKKTTKKDERTDLETGTGQAGGERQQLEQNTPMGRNEPRSETERLAGGTGRRGTGVDTDADRLRGGGVSRVASPAPLGAVAAGERKNTRNNYVERGTDTAPKGVDARIKANIEAIETLKRLQSSGEPATAADMEKLRAFSGWGGLGKAFNDWNYRDRLRRLIGQKQFDEDAQMSRNSAYFTPGYVVDALWDIARGLGFTGGRVLEGSAGIGNILGWMPRDLSERSTLHAIEKDSTTGGMLSLLYPDAKIDVQGFEETQIANGSVDLAITNAPFVPGMHVNDKTGDSDLSKKFRDIHNFCIAKNVRKLRDGGIGIFITTAGTLDGRGNLYKWLTNEGNSDVVGLFRLHNETFGGTNATSDIIVVRKRVNGVKSEHALDASKTTGVRVANYDDNGKTKTRSLSYNCYFVEHPEHMAGEMMFGFENGDTYRPTSVSLYPTKEKDQMSMLRAWVEEMQSKQFDEPERNDVGINHRELYTPTYDKVGNEVKTGTIVVNSKGEICINFDGEARPLMSEYDKKNPKTESDRIAQFNKNKIKGRSRPQVVEDYNAIKKALAKLLEYQKERQTDEGLQPLLNKLNRVFDDFVGKYGNLHGNRSLAWLKSDVDYSSVLALETYKEVGFNHEQVFGKSDILLRRVISRQEPPKATNVKDGVILSIRQTGELDTRYIADSLGIDEKEVRRQVLEARLGFENPLTHGIEAAHKYLSGNVREKLAQAEENNEGGKYSANIDALRRVIPHDIPSHLIEFNIGSSWISPSVFKDYFKERTGHEIKLTYVAGAWNMVAPKEWSWTEQNKAFGVHSSLLNKTVPGHELIFAAMSNRTIQVSSRTSDGETINDSKATSACAVKVDEIRDDFKSWMRQRMQDNEEFARQIETTYNDTFNNSVPMTIPDEYMPNYFDGAARVIGGKDIKMREHQAKAIIKGTMQSLMLAHEVGTGKTFTLITTAMEMRRLGTAKKPMIVVQNATIGQFVASAKALYPDARILSLDDKDRTAEGRKDFYAKIRYNDWDIVVIPQSVLEKIPDHPDRERQFIEESIYEKMEIIEALSQDRDAGRIVSNLKKEIEKMQDRLAELDTAEATSGNKKKDEKKTAIARENARVKAEEKLDRKTDDMLNFDDLGVDALLVDEAHEYKRLGFETTMQRGVKGIDPSYSKKCQGLFLKVKAVQEMNGGRNVIFATGTPISNTAAEVWTFMRYLLPRETMESYNIWHFDDFVRNFGSIQQMPEFTAAGKYKEVNRFAGYNNLPELARIWSSIADTVLTEEAGEVKSQIPELEGGKPTDIYLPQTNSLRTVLKYVKARIAEYEEMSGAEKKENRHIPLTMFGIAKAAAIDARLVMGNAVDEPHSKTNECVRQTLKALEDSKTYRGAVAIFADNYQRKNKQTGRVEFNLFEDIKAKLISNGIPSEQVAIMRDGLTDKQKEKIFEQVNAGEIRVILGTTQRLGVGVNMQERLFTEMHLDAPQRPMDYWQRMGRLLRQGNLHKEMDVPVRVIRFGVEDSLDVTAYQRLKTKGAIADAIMSSKKLLSNNLENRVIEEEGDEFGDITAQLSGSEYAILQNQTEKELRKLQAKQEQHRQHQIHIRQMEPFLQARIRNAERRIALNSTSLEKVSNAGTDIAVNGKSYTDHKQIEDLYKSSNKSIAERKGKAEAGETTKSSFKFTVGDVEYEWKVVVSPEVDYYGFNRIMTSQVKGVLSCPELWDGEKDMKTANLKRVIEFIREEVSTGKSFRVAYEQAINDKERAETDLDTLLKDKGKEFEHGDRIQELKDKLVEYTEKLKADLEAKEAKYAEMDAQVIDVNADEISFSMEDDGDVKPTASEPGMDYSSENANFASSYETQEGKTVRYTSENPEAYGGLFDFDFSAENAGGNEVGMRSRANDLQRQGDTDINRHDSRLDTDAGEFSHVERVFRENGYFNFTCGEKIESGDDVAFIFSALEDAAKEHSFVVLVKDGKPTVVELGMGTFTATMVDIPTASLAYNRIQPDQVYFVHNHPSGNLVCSHQDVEMLAKIADISKVPTYGVIINLKTGKYGTFDKDNNWGVGRKRVPENELPIAVHTLDKQIFSPDYDPMTQPLVRSSEDVAQFLNSHRMGDRAKMSFIILSRAGRIVGNIHTPFTRLTTKSDDIARYISERVIQFGGEAAILYGDFTTEGSKTEAYRYLKDSLKKVGETTMLDVVNIEGNHTRSALDEGLLYEPGSEHGASTDGDIRFRDGKKMSEVERFKLIQSLEPIEVELNNLSKKELFKEYRSLSEVVKDGERIQFLRTVFGKNYKEGGLFAQVAPYLDEMLNTSILAYSEEDSLGGTKRPDGTEHKAHPNVITFDNYVNKAKIGEREYYVRMTVQKTLDNTTGLHSCFVSNVDLYEKTATGETKSAILRRTNQPYDGIVDAKLAKFFERASKESNKGAMAERVEELFNRAVNGDLTGKSVSVGRLTAEGREYLERLSGLSFKPNVDFVLNPSDLVHIYRRHFGENERDGRNIPLTVDDIREMSDIISRPDRVVFAEERDGQRRKLFFFLKESAPGSYNLLEVYADRRGNLTSKSFFKSKEGVSHRVMSLLNDPALYVRDEWGNPLDDAKLPIFFEQATENSAELFSDVDSDGERRAMAKRVEELSERLGVKVRVVADEAAIEQLPTARRRRAKGWVDGDEVVIVLPNHDSVEDVEETFLHEVVGHYGLRRLIGKERFDAFLDEVFTHASDKIKAAIEHRAQMEYERWVETETRRRGGGAVAAAYATVEAEARKDSFRRTATEEYMAEMAEKIAYDGFERMSREEQTLWGRVKAKVMKFIEAIFKGLKISKSVTLTDKDIAYILYRSWKNLRDGGDPNNGGGTRLTALDIAEDAAMRHKTGYGERMREVGVEADTVEALNDKFNAELQQQIDGLLPQGHVYRFGKPGAILRAAGFPNAPIEMSATRLAEKSRQSNHLFDIADVKDLVKCLNNPIGVFRYGNNAKNVIVGIERDGKQYLVGVHFNQSRNGVEVSSIRGIFPKDNAEWLNWIAKDKADYLNKEKIQELIAQQRINLADVSYLNLDDVAKIVEEFENPTIAGEKTSTDEDAAMRHKTGYGERMREYSASQNDIAKLSERFDADIERYERGELPAGYRFELGMPSAELRSAGFPKLPISMRESLLTLKSGLGRHPFAASDLLGLVNAIQKPIAVFEYTNDNVRNLIVDLKSGDKHFLVGITLNFKRDGLEINSVSGLFPKDNHEWVKWIQDGRAIRIDQKEKVLSLIDSLRMNPAEAERIGLNLDDVAKIVEEFENPTIASEKTSTDEDVAMRHKTGYEKTGRSKATTGESVQGSRPGLNPSTYNASEHFAKTHKYDVSKIEKPNWRQTLYALSNLHSRAESTVLNSFSNSGTAKVAEKNELAKTNMTVADRIEELFEQAVNGEFKGIPVEVGRLTTEGRAYLEALSGLKLKASVRFVLNPSDLAHIYRRHFGANERDGQNIPLTKEDIRKIADIVSNPDKVVYAKEAQGDKRNMFFFLQNTEDGSYNLLEVYANKWGNLTSKSFFRSKKSASQRLLLLKESDKLTSVTDGPAQNDGAKLPTFFEISNNEEENVVYRDGDDVMTKDPVMARAMYEKRLQSSMYQFTEAMQDSMRGLMEFYRAVEAQSGNRDIKEVASFENAYVAENAMSSANRAQWEEYERKLFRPLLEVVVRMAKDKKGHEELIDYMMAKHGLERNAYMRQEASNNGEATDRDFAGLCGLTGEQDWQAAEAKAAQMVAAYEQAHSADIADLWAAVNRATKASLNKVYTSGLLSKDQYEKIRDMYQYYIPLRGFDEQTSSDVYAYLTGRDGAMTSPIRKAEGRKSKADDPLATIALIAQNSITQGNRNLMKQKFLNYVQNHPSDLASVNKVWLRYDAVNDEWTPVFADIDETMTPSEIEREILDFEQRMEAFAKAEPDKYKRGRDAVNIPYRVVDGKGAEHRVIVKRNGESFVITINGNPRAAQAINGITNPDNDLTGAIGTIFEVTGYINRWLSRAYTTANPDFVVSNL